MSRCALVREARGKAVRNRCISCENRRFSLIATGQQCLRASVEECASAQSPRRRPRPLRSARAEKAKGIQALRASLAQILSENQNMCYPLD
jgi:hypothetical protein